MTIEDQRKEMAEAIGKRMKEAIVRKGLVLKHLYGKLGITHSTMQNWLSGKNLPDITSLKILASLCDEDFVWMLSGERTPRLKEMEILHSECDQLKGRISMLNELLQDKFFRKKKVNSMASDRVDS